MRSKISKVVCWLILFCMIFLEYTGIRAAANGLVTGEDIQSQDAAAISENYNSEAVPGKIIVKYKNSITPEIPGLLSNKMSAKTVAADNISNVVKVVLPEGKNLYEAIREIKKDPNVEYAEPLYRNRAIGWFSSDKGNEVKTVVKSVYHEVYGADDPYYRDGFQWGLDRIHITEAWKKTEPDSISNITIAIIDSGVDLDHPDLMGSIVPGKDFVNNDDDANDDYGHGTRVAGIAAAISNNQTGIAGIAGGAKIMSIKTLDSTGSDENGYFIQAVRWAADHGARVINLSLGRPKYGYNQSGQKVDTFSQTEYEAVKYALDKGVVLAAAAGNEKGDAVCYPAAYPGVIAVGAVDSNLKVAGFSNVGPEVAVTAPGVGILSTRMTDGYGAGDGTSFATPFVSGLSALLVSADSSLAGSDIKRILEETADDLGIAGRDDAYGSGIIDAESAFSTPRIRIELSLDHSNDSLSSFLNLNISDHKGTVIKAVYNLSFSVDRYAAGVNNTYTWSAVQSTVSISSTANGGITAALSFPDVGIYRVKAVNDVIVDSNWAVIVKYGVKPVASLPSGSYSGTKTIGLSTTTAGAAIYYTLDGTEPTTGSLLYTEPISISRDTTLKAIAVKNSTKSDVSVYTYTITQPSSGTPGGGGFFGGGGAPAAVQEPVTTKNGSPAPNMAETDVGKIGARQESDGTIATSVFIDQDKFNRLLESSKDAVLAVNAKGDPKSEKTNIIIPVDSLKKLSAATKAIRLDMHKVAFHIQPGTFSTNQTGETLTISAAQLPIEQANTILSQKAVEASAASDVYSFEASVGNEKVEGFHKPVSITMSYDVSKVKNTKKLGVYYYNERDGKWEYVGGKANSEGTMTFETDHFSKYAVMEYHKTFGDIASHWARNDIEIMASRHVAKGIDEDTFSPDTSITRAQFAAILVRALNIQDVPAQNSFTDVLDSSWYSGEINKAYAAKLIEGMDREHFAPDEKITREQMAALLMRAYAYATGKNLDEIMTSTQVRFTDEDQADSWAIRSIILANAMGLMDGYEDSSFQPKGFATRAQAMAVIRRLVEKV